MDVDALQHFAPVILGCCDCLGRQQQCRGKDVALSPVGSFSALSEPARRRFRPSDTANAVLRLLPCDWLLLPGAWLPAGSALLRIGWMPWHTANMQG